MANSSKTKKSQSEKDSSSKKSKKGTSEKSRMNSDPDDSLHELFLDGIKDLYWAENHLLKAIPKMIRSASNEPLINALTDHLNVTQAHVIRLEEVFGLLNEKVKAKKCDAMEGLSKEGEGIIEDTEAGSEARDLGIIMASQKVEHYEISSYTGLSNLASKLGLSDISNLLQQTLSEEQESSNILSNIADSEISYPASQAENV